MNSSLVRWLGGVLFTVTVLSVSYALAEHPRWAPMAPQPTAKTNHKAHTSRSYRGRSPARIRNSNCAAVDGRKLQAFKSERSVSSAGPAAAPQARAVDAAPH
jgi:hypothetical protein